MNKIYRIVWNATLETWVAVSEITKNKKKSKTVGMVLAGVSIISFSSFAVGGQMMGGVSF